MCDIPVHEEGLVIATDYMFSSVASVLNVNVGLRFKCVNHSRAAKEWGLPYCACQPQTGSEAS